MQQNAQIEILHPKADEQKILVLQIVGQVCGEFRVFGHDGLKKPEQVIFGDNRRSAAFVGF